MNLEALAKKFIVTDDWLRDRLEVIATKLFRYCVIQKSGHVHVSDQSLSSKQKVMVVLAARAVGFQLDSTISESVTVKDLAKFTGLPENQVRARGNDWVRAKFAESPKRGTFRAVQHKIEQFINILSKEGIGHDQ